MTAYRTAYGASAGPRAEYVTGAWVEPEAVLAGQSAGPARPARGRTLERGALAGFERRISRARRGRRTNVRAAPPRGTTCRP